MAYWLFKSEPETWSWDNQTAKGAAGEEWSGVRNYQARNVMRDMAKGDLGFFYHSGSAREIVGVVKVIAGVHPDSSDDTGTWECVDIAAVRPFEEPVSLARIKEDGAFAEMVLVKNTRLSVQPVTKTEFNKICRLGGLDPKAL